MSLKRVVIGLVSIALGVGGPSGVRALEGQLEIHPACVATGCFPGDAPGFPVEIEEAGTYVLTGGLSVPAGMGAISIATSNVTLDLRGFSIVCAAAGACTDGIASAGGAVTIEGGTISGFGGIGISGASLGATYVKDLTVIGDPDSTVAGIHLGRGSQIRGVIVHSADGDGIIVGDNSSVSSSISVDNGGNGISAGGGSHLVENVCAGNRGSGIDLRLVGGPGTIVARNSLTGNSTGIKVVQDARVIGNTVRSNSTGMSAHLSVRLAYGRNVLAANGAAEEQVVFFTGSQGFEIGTNYCGTDTVCP